MQDFTRFCDVHGILPATDGNAGLIREKAPGDWESTNLPMGLLHFPLSKFLEPSLVRYSAFTMHSTGQTVTHCGESWCPSHSTHVLWSMTYRTPSPSLIDSVGHSGIHAPQAMHSSVIFMVMESCSFVKYLT